MNMHYPIRILHWGLTSARGGIETIVMDWYRHIDRNLIQFDFLESHDQPTMAFESEITSLGGRIYRVMYSQHESLIKSRFTLYELMKDHRIDAIHVNANFPYAFPLKIARESGIAVRILHSHNAGGDEKPARGILAQTVRSYREHSVKKQIDKYPTHYLACSEKAGNWMFPRKDFSVLKNGIDVEKFRFNKQVREFVRDKLGIEKSTVVVGFCGRFRSQKNPLFAIEIFAQYLVLNSDAVFIMVGIGELQDEINKRIDELGIRNHVLLLGSRSDVHELYQAMDAFILPSLFEGLGIVYIEAQCAGLPTLGSLDVVPNEACVNRHLFRFVSLKDSAEQWALALQEQIERTGDRGDGSSEVCAAGYDIRDVTLQLQNLYLSSVEAEK